MKARTSSARSLSSGPAIRGTSGERRLLFALRLLGWALALMCALAFVAMAEGCAARRVPAPVVVSVCPPIPVPARPAAPHVILPAPDAAGNYCLTQAQVNDLATGLKDLQLYAAQLAAAVHVYNAHTQATEAGRRTP